MRNLGSQFNQDTLTRVQIDQFKDKISQLVQGVHTQLGAMKLMSVQTRRSINQKVNSLATHAQEILLDFNSQAQTDLIIKKLNLDFQQIIIREQLRTVVDLVINRIHQSSLTDDQQSTAISEIETAQRFSIEDMKKATSDFAIKSAFTTGVNAINGALAKYVADSQINAIDQVKQLINQNKAKLSQNTSMSVNAHNLINHQLDVLKQHAVDDLLTSVNFVQLAKTRQHYVDQLDAMASDKYHIVQDLASFNQFMRQADDVIISLTLSSDDKMRIEQRINQYQDTSIDKLKHAVMLKPEYISSVKHQIIVTIIDAASQHYQQEIAAQTLMLSDIQRDSLIDQVKQTAKRITQRPLSELTKPKLMQALYQLSTIVQKRKALMYQSQVSQAVNQIKAQINQLYDIPEAGRDYLKSQVVSFSKRMKDHKSDWDKTQQTLQQFFQTQFNFVRELNLQRDLTSLLRQIHYSSLNELQQRTLSQRLVTIKQNHELNYSNQQLFIKDLMNEGLKLDQVQNEHRLQTLNQRIFEHVDTLTELSLGSKFTQIKARFEQSIANVSQIKDLEHQAQLAENEMCLTSYHLKYSTKSVSNQILIKLTNRVRTQINDAILRSGLKRLIMDRFDHFFDRQLLMLMNKSNSNARLSKITKDTQTYLTAVLNAVKQADAQQLKDLAQEANYQLKAYSSNNYAGNLNQISSHAVIQIKGASDLSWVEAMKQAGWQKINAFSNRMIDKLNSAKAQAHQNIMKLMAVTKGYLGHHMNLVTSNHILMIVNQSNERVNQGLNAQSDDLMTDCRKALDRILRQRYLQVWQVIVDQAQVNVAKLVQVPLDDRKRAAKQIQTIDSQVIPDLKRVSGNQLSLLIHKHQTNVQALVNQTSYLDPAKRKVRTRLTQLIQVIERDAKEYQITRDQAKTVQGLHQLNSQLNRQLSTTDDHQLQQIYQMNRKRLLTWQLTIVQNAQLKRFGKLTKKTEAQLQTFKFLSRRKVRQMVAKLNRCYYKTMYDIKHSPDAEFCLHNEYAGEKQLDQLVAHNRNYNNHKQRIYTTILSQVAHAKQQVNDLQYVQDKDKQSSLQLLKQVKQVAVHQVKKAVNHKQIFAIEDHNNQAIRQVTNNVISANVILAAIQSANERISESNLNRRQKTSALKQIHQIINNGLEAQAEAKTEPKNRKRQTRSDVRSTTDQIFTPRRAPRQHHPLTELINVIGHFFRWLFGKLAREL